MRHTSKSGLPKSVALLSPRVVCPASLRLLVSAPGRPNRVSSSFPAARPRAVPLPAITPRAHHHLTLASVAAQQSSVARRIRCLSHGQRAGGESARKALYSSRGARPPWTAAGLVFNVPLGPLPVFFSAADYPSTHSSPSTHTHRLATSIDDAALSTTALYSRNHAGLGSRRQWIEWRADCRWKPTLAPGRPRDSRGS